MKDKKVNKNTLRGIQRTASKCANWLFFFSLTDYCQGTKADRKLLEKAAYTLQRLSVQ